MLDLLAPNEVAISLQGSMNPKQQSTLEGPFLLNFDFGNISTQSHRSDDNGPRNERISMVPEFVPDISVSYSDRGQSNPQVCDIKCLEIGELHGDRTAITKLRCESPPDVERQAIQNGIERSAIRVILA